MSSGDSHSVTSSSSSRLSPHTREDQRPDADEPTENTLTQNSTSSRGPPSHLRVTDRFLDSDDFQPALPSPPYKKFASSSNLVLEDYPSQTPPYRSNTDLHLMDEKHRDDDSDHNDSKATPRPTVHYHEDVRAPATPPRLGSESPSRPGFGFHSRQSSLAGTDDEDDESEDYDWSGEEDLVDEEAKYEQKMGVARKRTSGFRHILSLLFGSLIGSVFLAVVLATGPILVYFLWYKHHPSEHRRYVVDNVEAWLFWAAANVIVSWWLAMLIDIVPAVIRGIVAAAWGHVSEEIKTRLELYNSVKGTIKPLFYAASGWVSWIIIFEKIYNLYDADHTDQSRAHYTHTVSQVIEFLFFLVLVWCAQKMLSHAIAFSFHQTAFKERIDDLREALRVIEHLRDYRPKPRVRGHGRNHGSRTPVFSAIVRSSLVNNPAVEKAAAALRSSSRPGTPVTDSDWDGDAEDHAGGSWAARGKGKKRASAIAAAAVASGEGSPHRYPPTPVGAAGSDSDDDGPAVVHAARVLKNAVLHDARNIEGKDADTAGLVWDVSSAHEAKRLARLIYTSLRDRGRRYLLPADFERAYATPEDAQRAFRVFDADNNGDLSRAEIKTKLLKVYKERRFLSRSMRDVGAALHTLDIILLFFAAVILFFVSLSVFDVSIGSSLTSVYSLGIAASFIFKNAASNAFDAIMFLFVTHPFDTGDRCFIDEENMVVKKMGLFATVFARSDGTETYYFNSQLFQKFITNCRRSDKTSETLSMQVAWRTPFEKLDALEKCMNEWLARDENRWYVPSTSVTLQHIKYQRHLEITIGIAHNGNWQDWGLRNARRTAFHAAVQYYCRQLGIAAAQSPMPLVWSDADAVLPAFAGNGAGAVDVPPSPSLAAVDGQPGQEAAPGPVEGATQGPTQGSMHKHPHQKRNWLGFVPPDDAPSEIRARKSTSRKVAMRALGADG
ncbi:Mechanosensitive ion channel-domain-containing protein [Gloeopeniophorella convolvens]|nr:Mechanosensitive ion channel-domain-containing protein [Gloeopeniophorella convolvens]